MSKTAVLTDSASDIPRELEDKYGIDILPFSIVVDGQSYTERVDFTNEQYYEMLTKAEGIPKTSQITMLRFLEKFCAYADEGYTDVIFVSINSAGSNTYNAACMAAESLRDERPGCTMNVHVVDSHTYSMTYGWHVCEAARKLQAGADVKSVVEYLEDQLARMEIMLSMYTLRFVKKSGRVSAAAAFAGELLGLRPIIHMVDDTTSTIAKVRGDSVVMPGLIVQTKKRMAEGTPYLIGATDDGNAKMLAKMCKKEFGYAPAATFLLGADVVFNHADYRLLSKRALEGLAEFREVNLFLRGLVPLVGYRCSSVYYERAERIAGESHYPLKKMLAFAFDGITSLSVKPLRLITLAGMLVSAVSFVAIIVTLITKLVGFTVTGWTSMICAIYFLGGVQLLGIGVIGEYVGKIYNETKARPRFIISETTFEKEKP